MPVRIDNENIRGLKKEHVFGEGAEHRTRGRVRSPSREAAGETVVCTDHLGEMD